MKTLIKKIRKTSARLEAALAKPIKMPSLVITPEQWAAVRALPPSKPKAVPAPVKSPAQAGAEDAERLLARGSGQWRKAR
jgi:hypothetical protein